MLIVDDGPDCFIVFIILDCNLISTMSNPLISLKHVDTVIVG